MNREISRANLETPKTPAIPAWLRSSLTTLAFTAGSLGIIVGVWMIVRAFVGTDLPSPTATVAVFWELIKNPFHYGGPNDQGVGLLLLSSLQRVGLGWPS